MTDKKQTQAASSNIENCKFCNQPPKLVEWSSGNFKVICFYKDCPDNNKNKAIAEWNKENAK
jgi:hypothetical protein